MDMERKWKEKTIFDEVVDGNEVKVIVCCDKQYLGYDKMLVNGELNLISPCDVGSTIRYLITSTSPFEDIAKHTWLSSIDGL